MLDRIADGRTDLVIPYVVSGNSAKSTGAAGVRLISWCAYYGDVSAIRFLLNHGESLTSLGSNFDLNGACFHGHWQLCQFLLENGADPNNTLPGTGETPLHAAASSRRGDLVVAVLLNHGADPNRKTIPHVETGAFMRDCRTRGETPLHRAAAFSSEQTIQRLVEAGAALDERDANGDSPLTWASWHGRPATLLRRLCFGPHRIHPDNRYMEESLRGMPHPTDS